MYLKCLSGPRMVLNGPKVVSNGPKSKLGLPRVIMGLNKSLNQSPRDGLEKIGYASSNGLLGNCYKGHVLRGENGESTLSF